MYIYFILAFIAAVVATFLLASSVFALAAAAAFLSARSVLAIAAAVANSCRLRVVIQIKR